MSKAQLDPHEYLTNCMERAAAKGRYTDALMLSLARDALDTNGLLLDAIRAHRFDTEHLVEKLGKKKGYRPRLADQMLYEAAGLEPVDGGRYG